MRITAPHKVEADTDHYRAVRAYMQANGAPTIRAVWDDCFGEYIALEGSHRLAIAAELGLTADVEAVEYSDDLANQYGLDNCDPEMTVAEFVDAAARDRRPSFVFEDAE